MIERSDASMHTVHPTPASIPRAGVYNFLGFSLHKRAMKPLRVGEFAEEPEILHHRCHGWRGFLSFMFGTAPAVNIFIRGRHTDTDAYLGREHTDIFEGLQCALMHRAGAAMTLCVDHMA